MVDFVLVMLILVPLFAAVLQVGLTLYVRNTIAACAQEGARYGAVADFVAQGDEVMATRAVQRATGCISDALSASYANQVSASPGADVDADEVPVDVVEVKVSAPVPVLGLWAIGGHAIVVKGDAVQERVP